MVRAFRIEKTLPGELEGKIHPEDYGFEIIREEPPDSRESARRVARLYDQVKETGMVIPAIERYLDETPSSPQADAGGSAHRART
jgi:hypothetical protein